MSSLSCSKVEAALWCYVDREMSARELQAITHHLQSCAKCRRLYDDRARESRLWTCAFTGTRFGDGARGEGFLRDFRTRLEERGLTDRYPRDSRRREWTSGPVWSPVYRRLAVVAAMLLLIPAIVVVGLLVRTEGVDSLGTCVVRSGTAKVGVRLSQVNTKEVFRSEGAPDSGLQTLKPGEETAVVRGSFMNVAADSAVLLELGADRIEIDGPARLEVGPEATRADFSAYLVRGRLLARVASRRSGDAGVRGVSEGSFVVFTPHATARVVGTRFRLEVGSDETRLFVEEGKVSFRPLTFVGERGRAGPVFTPDDPPQRIRSLLSTPEPVSRARPDVRQPPEPAPAGSGAAMDSSEPESGGTEEPSPAPASTQLDQPLRGNVDKGELDNPANSPRDEDEPR